MIIDFHTHAFPDALAPRAMGKLAAASGIKPYTDGTISDLLRLMQDKGVDRSVVCNIATNAKQTDNVNAFAFDTNKKYYGKITALGSVHPETPNIASVLQAFKKENVPGIKLHPDYMGYDFSDPAFSPILDLCQELDLFVIIHAGFDPISPNHVHATPEMILQRIHEFPRLKLVAAHFGSCRMIQEVLDNLVGQNVYFDTSLNYENHYDTNLEKQVFLKHDKYRILFGSDCPWADPKTNFDHLLSLNLPSEIIDRIAYQNALELLKL